MPYDKAALVLTEKNNEVPNPVADVFQAQTAEPEKPAVTPEQQPEPVIKSEDGQKKRKSPKAKAGNQRRTVPKEGGC